MIPRIRLHADGPEVSRIAQGFGSLVQEENPSAQSLAAYINACLAEGITLFDLAAVYAGGRAEELFGEALSLDEGLRSKMCILTKYGIEGGGNGYHCYNTDREAILRSCERSLRRMRTDRVDIFLMHRPDMLMDADEVAEALIALRQDGKVAHVGVSNFLPHQFDLLQSRLPFPLVTNEVPYSLFDMEAQENGALDQCQKLRIAPLFYAPLGGGRLFKPTREACDARIQDALHQIAEAHGGVPIEQVAIAWALRHPVRGTAVLGCGRVDWMRRAAAGARMRLTRDEWFSLWTASKGYDIP